MLQPARVSPSFLFRQSKCEDVFFKSAKRVFIVAHAREIKGLQLSILLCKNKSTVSRVVNRFPETGSVQDRNRPGRLSVVSDETARNLFCSPRKSLRKLPVHSGLSVLRSEIIMQEFVPPS